MVKSENQYFYIGPTILNNLETIGTKDVLTHFLK